MKKLFTLLLVFTIFFGTTQLDAQSQRMVLVEEATQASCPPCATQNPPLQALLNQNLDKAIFIGYQVWWPGYDAMYLDNEAGVDWRIGTYYPDINGAPNVKVQGVSAAEVPSAYLNQAYIDNINSQMSEFDITLNASVDNGILTVTGSVDGTATYDAAGDLRLRLVVLEHVIYNEDLIQIGTNGETEFHNVFKKWLPGFDGLDLADNWVDGDNFTFTETYDLGQLNIYHYDGLEVVAMIQDDGNKYIPQAARADDIPVTVEFANNGSASSIDGLPDVVCLGEQTISPEVKIQNGGNENLTSLEINYDVNGGTPQTYMWTGDLSTLASETVTLDPITFVAETDNMVNVSLAMPNGVADEDTSNDNLSSAPFSLAPSSTDSVMVSVFTDNYGDEVYWEIRNSGGAVVGFGGNPNVGTTNIGTGQFPAPPHPDMYLNATLYTHIVPIDLDDCYTFHITDYYGDGMTLAATPAYYIVVDSEGNQMISGGGTDSYTEVLNDYQGAVFVGTYENVLNNEFTVAPNPVSDNTTLGFTLPESQETMIRVFNVAGQEVLVKNLGLLGAGTYQENLSLIDLNPGVYFINLISGNNTGLKKVTVLR